MDKSEYVLAAKKDEQYRRNNGIKRSRRLAWIGVATADIQSKGKYLQTGNIENQFFLEPNIHKIPIIKNGSSMSLKPVQIGKNKYSLTNTCAFDSILQLFIAAYFDAQSIKALICNTKD